MLALLAKILFSYSSSKLLCILLFRKSRPQNGPGANHIRGGKREYSDKTTIGPWVESTGGPMHYKRGFTTEEFLTEAQRQQMGVAKLRPYGAALPNEFEIMRANNVNNTDVFHPPNGPNAISWQTSIQAMNSTQNMRQVSTPCTYSKQV